LASVPIGIGGEPERGDVWQPGARDRRQAHDGRLSEVVQDPVVEHSA
jgi:hypothetical protein